MTTNQTAYFCTYENAKHRLGRQLSLRVADGIYLRKLPELNIGLLTLIRSLLF